MKKLFLIITLLASLSSAFAADQDFRFKVLQLNTWMLRLPIGLSIAEEINPRAVILPDVVARTGADIVFFQELWAGRVRKHVVQELNKLGYKYIAHRGHFAFLRGMLGNGLLIASKFPLDTRTDVLRFKEYTESDEFFAYKGAIHTRVEIPEVGAVDLYDSHLGAVGYDPKKGEYNPGQEARKTQQARELVKWIETTKSEPIQILSADLNSHYYDMERGNWTGTISDVYRLMTDSSSGLGFVDSYHSLHGFPAGDCTYCLDNLFASGGHYGNAPSEVEDYTFISKNNRVSVESSSIVFKEDLSLETSLTSEFHLPDMPKHISDHYGLLTTFIVHPSNP